MAEDLLTRIRVRADDPRTRTNNFDPGFPARFAPAPEAALSDAVRRLGSPLPAFLARVYLEVGNGGFGPGYGLIGLPGGYTGDEGGSVVDLYESRRAWATDGRGQRWPEAVVPFCEWGCAIYTCVDCHSGAVLTFDPNTSDWDAPAGLAFGQTHPSVRAWFEDWVEGVSLWAKMFEHAPERDATIINPFTRQPFVVRGQRVRRPVSFPNDSPRQAGPANDG
jgi:hypothetical protein